MTGGPCSGLVHHSDRGSQYVSINYTERLAEAGVEDEVKLRIVEESFVGDWSSGLSDGLKARDFPMEGQSWRQGDRRIRACCGRS